MAAMQRLTSAVAPVWVGCLFLTAIVACSSDGADFTSVDSITAPTMAPDQPAQDQPAPDQTVAGPGSTSSTGDVTNESDADPPATCRVLSDFTNPDGQALWRSVNDDVMGGRSLGGLSFSDDALVFEGVVDTDGGGFSSIRLPIDVGSLAGDSSIAIRATSDGRSYMLTLDDSLETRDRRVTHRATIDLGGTETDESFEIGVAILPFDGFTPAIFGQPIDDAPLEPSLIDELGLMISDGLDGPFRLEVAWIASCP